MAPASVPVQQEDPKYLSDQLITYIGSKRALLPFIGTGVRRVQERLGKEKLDVFDAFSGSGAVARFLKSFSRKLAVNDIEAYSFVTNQCYLANRSEVPFDCLARWHSSLVARLTEDSLKSGIVSELYSPADMNRILPGERCFYTPRNARFLDTARQLIDEVPSDLQAFLLAPLLSEASVHANTSGVFKGFHKDRTTKVGQFGGTGKDALLRILGNIELPMPILSRFECDVQVYKEDSNVLASRIGSIDLAYIDPPYNQHPYGSNYFMLNLLVDYKRPASVSSVSGIPTDWQRSSYNKKPKACAALTSLVHDLDAKFLLISFNSEGFVSQDEMTSMLRRVGTVDVLETRYNTFRGSRNLHGRSKHVKEYLYLVEKR